MSTNYTDHDPLAPSAEASAQMEADLLACIASTSLMHPDASTLTEFVRRKSQPMDLRAVKDSD